jgi:four helix bundle protein
MDVSLPRHNWERGHHRLDAWKISRQLVVSVYRLTQHFPKAEMFGLTAQMRRSAVSIPANIAEGAARTGIREFVQFLNIARGSLSELETHLLIAVDLDYVRSQDPIFDLLDRVSQLLTGLHKALNSRRSAA